MQIVVWLLMVFITIAVAGLAFGAAYEEKNARARRLRERLSGLDAAARRNPSEEIDLLRDELMSEIPALNLLLTRWSRAESLQQRLNQAGVNLRAGKFLLTVACTAAAAMVVGLTFGNTWLLGFVGAGVGAAIPFVYVSFRRVRRFRRFEQMFPEAIELLVRATRAGHPFTSALELIANELGEPIAGEFRKVFEEQKYGLPIRDALLNLTVRMPLLDVKFFVTSVMLQRETGGNLAEILEKLAYVIRERFKIRRQVRVYTAQGRLTMGLLMILPPGVVFLISLIDPDLIKLLFVDPLGHMMIAVAVIMQSIGYVLLRKIINIEV
jgi:tight adherence protein B